jgi:hypothetical protein
MFAINSTGQRNAQLKLNGIHIAQYAITSVAVGRSPIIISTIYKLTAGDSAECFVYQNSGGDLTVDSLGNSSPEFMMVRLP